MRTFVRILAVLATTLTAAVAGLGVAGPAHAAQLSPSIKECLVFRPLLEQGTSQHACTAAWQGFLSSEFPRGIGQTPGLAVDGQFGNATALATARYQLDGELAADGKVGNQTWGHVQSDCNFFWSIHYAVCDTKYFY